MFPYLAYDVVLIVNQGLLNKHCLGCQKKCGFSNFYATFPRQQLLHQCLFSCFKWASLASNNSISLSAAVRTEAIFCCSFNAGKINGKLHKASNPTDSLTEPCVLFFLFFVLPHVTASNSLSKLFEALSHLY